MDPMHAIVKPAWLVGHEIQLRSDEDLGSRSQWAVSRATVAPLAQTTVDCLDDAAANCRTGQSIISIRFSLGFSAAHAPRREIRRLRPATERQIIFTTSGGGRFSGGTLETCDDVTHAAEPVKFDNLCKSAQR
jgi:hypothetical protein